MPGQRLPAAQAVTLCMVLRRGSHAVQTPAGQLQPQQVSRAKWNNCRMAIDIARECRDLLGGAGITTEHSAIRHALNLESVITYEGTETVHQLVIGRELTGISAF